MRRTRTIGVLGAVLAVLLAPAAAIAFGDAKGPPCADLTTANDASKSFYSFDETTGVYAVDAQLELSATACRNVTYTFYAVAEDGTTVLASGEGTPGTDPNTGAPVVVFHLELQSPGPDVINTYATTSRGGKVLDRGPDDGFISLALGVAPASRGYG